MTFEDNKEVICLSLKERDDIQWQRKLFGILLKDMNIPVSVEQGNAAKSRER